MKIPMRTELQILSDDSNQKPLGWLIKENIGIAVINTWIFKPWYRKIWHKRFWLDPFKRVKKTKTIPTEY